MYLFLIIITSLIALIFAFMQQKSFGKIPSGKRLERIKNSPHYQKGNFQNFSKTQMLAQNISYFDVMKHAMKKTKDKIPPLPIPTIKTNLLAAPTTQAPIITWFGHSSYLLQIEGKNILVDPVFSKRASFSQYIGPKAFEGTMAYKVDDLPAIDAVILTHDHYDHLDYPTIMQLKAKTKAFYTSLGVGAHLTYWGVEEEKITELDWWEDTKIFENMELITTHARHFSGRGIIRNKSFWSSFVLRTSTHTIFLGGDSGYDTHFKEIGNKYGPFDLVILECGQYDGYWPQIHMMPEQTIQASIDLQAKLLFPLHWGKFSLAPHAWNDSIIRATKKAAQLNVKITSPMIGEQIILDSIYPDKVWWLF